MLTIPYSTLAYVGMLAANLVAAQTPPGTLPQTNNKLQVVYGNQSIDPGTTQAKALVAAAPNVSLAANPTESFTLIMLDLSVHLTPDAPNTTLVHYAQSNLKTSSGLKTALSSSDPPEAPYIGPSPPAGQTHIYVFYLFRQPIPFAIPDQYKAYFANITASVTNRVGFNMTEFATAAKLVGPVAANWLEVSTPPGSSTSSGTSTATVSSTGTGSGSQPTSTVAGSGANGFVSGRGYFGLVVSGLAWPISFFFLS